MSDQPTVDAPPLDCNMLLWQRCEDRRYINVFTGGKRGGYVGSFAVNTLPSSDALRDCEDAWEECDQERERFSDALSETHVELGGDGEWVARPGQVCRPGETGDLAFDCPSLARELAAKAATLRARVAELEGIDRIDADGIREYTERAKKAEARIAELEAERAALEGELDDIDETEAERDHARAQLMDIAVALGVSRTDAANPPYLVQAVERLRAERDEALAEVARFNAAYEEEVAEFSLGFDAAMRGDSPNSEPSGLKHDVWGVGHAWGSVDRLRAEVERLEAERDEALALLRRAKELADAGDPKGGYWEDGVTGERMWKAVIDCHTYACIDALLARLEGEAGDE